MTRDELIEELKKYPDFKVAVRGESQAYIVSKVYEVKMYQTVSKLGNIYNELKGDQTGKVISWKLVLELS